MSKLRISQLRISPEKDKRKKVTTMAATTTTTSTTASITPKHCNSTSNNNLSQSHCQPNALGARWAGTPRIQARGSTPSHLPRSSFSQPWRNDVTCIVSPHVVVSDIALFKKQRNCISNPGGSIHLVWRAPSFHTSQPQAGSFACRNRNRRHS